MNQCRGNKCHFLCTAGEADLVFCPYNYLIDPVIRKSMEVDISNCVLIFDEAHNIEDNSRCGRGWSSWA